MIYVCGVQIIINPSLLDYFNNPYRVRALMLKLRCYIEKGTLIVSKETQKYNAIPKHT